MKARNLSPRKKDRGKKLYIDEMFYSIQTEGPLAGRPAYFIRLFGCNLNCAFCDTPQKKAKKIKVADILKRVLTESVSPLVVITGGEPLLQNLEPLITAIIRSGRYVQLETNGTLFQENIPWLPQSVFVVVSPKTKKIDRRIAAKAMAFKYVVSRENRNPKTGLPRGLYQPDPKDQQKIMVSPMWSDIPDETDRNIATTLLICKEFGYYFSFQYHKILGIK